MNQVLYIINISLFDEVFLHWVLLTQQFRLQRSKYILRPYSRQAKAKAKKECENG